MLSDKFRFWFNYGPCEILRCFTCTFLEAKRIKNSTLDLLKIWRKDYLSTIMGYLHQQSIAFHLI